MDVRPTVLSAAQQEELNKHKVRVGVSACGWRCPAQR
jgi:hypothetical protein